MNKIFYSILSLSLATASLTSCTNDSLDPEVKLEKDITTSPLSSLNDLKMVVNGGYKAMMSEYYYGRDYIIYNEVRSDNAISNGNSGRFVYESDFNVQISSSYPSDTWLSIYKMIGYANIAINANITEAGAEDAIQNYQAQAYALRALGHFDLLKLYGQQNVDKSTTALGVPYITKYGAPTAENYTRKTVAEVKELIYADMDLALSLANDDTSDYNVLNKQSILALKARMAMYMAPFFGDSEYTVALNAANEAIALGGTVANATDFVANFNNGISGSNSVFTLAFLPTDNNGVNSLYQLYNDTPYGDIQPAEEVKTVLFADASDVRGGVAMLKKVGSTLRNVGKYTTRYAPVDIIRYEEIVLTAAEAAFRTGDSNTALTLVNSVATNRGVAALSSVTLEDILTERRKEFIFEGFRFDDLMRNQKDIPAVSARNASNTPAYGDVRLAFPIPLAEVNASGITQNKGY
ncbi:MAG: RagB/SusD family nutrient uptake outer membrane protein [Flavobacterium sp.]|nr:RagB/SusD family nutrient uptake outer membrane protein [Candidatus Neoflavobacterium equi]